MLEVNASVRIVKRGILNMTSLSGRTTVCGALALMTIPAPAIAAPDFTTLSNISVFEPRETVVDMYLPTANNPMGCTAAGWFRLDSTASNYQAIYSLLLSTYMTGKRVKLYSFSCASDGTSMVKAAWSE